MASWWWFIQTVPLSQEFDYVSGTQPIYIGEAQPGSSVNASAWRIRKFTYDGNGNVLTILWSPNYSNFGDVWANRASLSYS